MSRKYSIKVTASTVQCPILLVPYCQTHWMAHLMQKCSWNNFGTVWIELVVKITDVFSGLCAKVALISYFICLIGLGLSSCNLPPSHFRYANLSDLALMRNRALPDPDCLSSQPSPSNVPIMAFFVCLFMRERLDYIIIP